MSRFNPLVVLGRKKREGWRQERRMEERKLSRGRRKEGGRTERREEREMEGKVERREGG